MSADGAQSGIERLLVVDDEGPILHALQRTFEAAGYDVTACLDPAEALDRLKERPYQVLSADYMMPGMTGAEFLARARALQPETIRILITAAHDFSAAVDAINNGEIFRILAKPWNRVELLGTVRQAFDTYALRERNRQLTAIVQSQNAELAALNKGLEALVDERTTNLLDGMVAVLDYRDTETQWHSRRVSRFTKRIAQELGVSDGHTLRTIEMGALLHDIGKIGVRDADLADVVQKRAHLDGPQRVAVGHTQLLRDPLGEPRDAPRVPLRLGVAVVEHRHHAVEQVGGALVDQRL